MSKHNVRLGLALPAYFVFAGFILLQTRDYASASSALLDAGNAHKVIANLCAAGLLAYYFLRFGISLKWGGAQKAYFTYLMCALLSSVAFSSQPLYSLWKLFEVSLVFMLSIFVLGRSGKVPGYPLFLYETSIRFIQLLLISTFIGALLYPNEAIRAPISEESMLIYGDPLLPYQIAGVIFQINPNSVGAFSAVILFIYGVNLVYQGRTPANVFWFFLSLAFLVLAQSRTAWLGVATATVGVILLAGKGRLLARAMVLVLLFLAAYLAWEKVLLYLTRGYDADRLSQLSGRSLWWGTAFDVYSSASPFEQLFGLGYMAANRAVLSLIGAGEASTLHSDYMDALVSTGAVGAISVLLVFVITLRATYGNARLDGSPIALQMFGVSLILFVRSFTGTTVGSTGVFLVLMLSIGVLSLSMRRLRIGQRQHSVS